MTANPATAGAVDETAYGGCRQIKYVEQEAEDWIGCDDCESMLHFWRAGLNRRLEENEECFCD